MATSEHEPEVLSLDNLTGDFNLSSVTVYNIINIGRHVIHSFESTYNFCVQLKLINRQRNCPRCRRSLKLSIERRPAHKTPVVFRCTNISCTKAKAYFSIRESTFFENSNLSLQQIILLVNLFCGEVKSYEQIQFQSQLDADSCLSTATIADWLSYCREVCLETVARETPKLIGGRGLTVSLAKESITRVE